MNRNRPIFLGAAVAVILSMPASGQAQDAAIPPLDKVVIEGASVKSSRPYKRLLTFHKRFTGIAPADRDKVELSFFLIPKPGFNIDPAALRFSLVGKDLASAFRASPDMRLEIPFEKHSDDDLAEVIANANFDNFDQDAAVTLKFSGEQIPIPYIQEALIQATYVYRRTFNPFSSTKRSVSVSFGRDIKGSVSVACPGQPNQRPQGAEQQSFVHIKIDDSWAENKCSLVLSTPAIRILAI